MKKIKVGKHTYIIGTTKGFGSRIFYSVQRDDSKTLKTFDKKSDIPYSYPNLRGKLKGI